MWRPGAASIDDVESLYRDLEAFGHRLRGGTSGASGDDGDENDSTHNFFDGMSYPFPLLVWVFLPVWANSQWAVLGNAPDDSFDEIDAGTVRPWFRDWWWQW